MSKAQARRAIAKVAQMVFDQDPELFTQSGLCCAAIMIRENRSRAGLDEICRMIQGYMKPNQSWLAQPGTKWDQRAMFALLVAEAEK